MTNDRYTKKEIQFLKENFKKGFAFCAQLLKRPVKGTINKCFRLQLKTNTKHGAPIWKESEIELLKNNYPQMGAKWCAEQLGTTKERVLSKSRILGLKLESRETKSDVCSGFDTKPFIKNFIPESVYLLGLIWADGHVDKNTNRITVGLVTTDFKNIQTIFEKTGNWNFKERFPENRRPITYAYVSNLTFKNYLFDNNYLSKSNVSANRILSAIPEDLKHYWWRGIFDGDGWLNYGDGYHFGICSSFNQNWDFAEELFGKLGIKYYISKREQNTGNSSEIDCSNYNGVKKFCEYIYQGQIFGLKRKYNKFKNILNYYSAPRGKKPKIYV